MDSWLVFRTDRVILNQSTKRNDRSSKWFPKASLIWSFSPSDKRSWMFRRQVWHSMESAHRIFSRPDCDNTAEVPSFTLRTALSICFWSVWCRRTMIPGKIFTGFAKSQGTVSVNDFRLPIWLQELLQASLCFLWSFCSARIRLDPLGGLSPAPRLQIDDCFEIRHYHWGLCDLCVIKSPKFAARGTAPPMRLLHGPLVIMVLWQITQFRSFGKWE